jgi:hypothetical protein
MGLLMHPGTILIGAAALMAAGATTPPTKPKAAVPGIVHLVPANFARLRSDFNAAPDRPRALVMLSPSCGSCVKGAAAFGDLLRQMPQESLRVLVVWERVLAADSLPPGPALRALIADPRATHYWDPGLLASREVVRLSEERYGRPIKEGGKAYDIVLLFAPGARWGELLPAPRYSNGPLPEVIEVVRERLAEMGAERP